MAKYALDDLFVRAQLIQVRSNATPEAMPAIPFQSEKQQELVAAYLPILRLGPLARMQGFIQEFPMTLPAINEAGQADGEIVIGSYRQLYDFIDRNKDIAFRHFQLVHGEIEG